MTIQGGLGPGVAAAAVFIVVFVLLGIVITVVCCAQAKKRRDQANERKVVETGRARQQTLLDSYGNNNNNNNNNNNSGSSIFTPLGGVEMSSLEPDFSTIYDGGAAGGGGGGGGGKSGGLVVAQSVEVTSGDAIPVATPMAGAVGSGTGGTFGGSVSGGGMIGAAQLAASDTIRMEKERRKLMEDGAGVRGGAGGGNFGGFSVPTQDNETEGMNSFGVHVPVNTAAPPTPPGGPSAAVTDADIPAAWGQASKEGGARV